MWFLALYPEHRALLQHMHDVRDFIRTVILENSHKKRRHSTDLEKRLSLVVCIDRVLFFNVIFALVGTCRIYTLIRVSGTEVLRQPGACADIAMRELLALTFFTEKNLDPEAGKGEKDWKKLEKSSEDEN